MMKKTFSSAVLALAVFFISCNKDTSETIQEDPVFPTPEETVNTIGGATYESRESFCFFT